MNRAERRHRTERIRSRRIFIYNQVYDSWIFKSEDRIRSWYTCSTYFKDIITEERLQEIIDEEAEKRKRLHGQMRERLHYDPRYDPDYWMAGIRKKQKMSDFDYWLQMTEVESCAVQRPCNFVRCKFWTD